MATHLTTMIPSLKNMPNMFIVWPNSMILLLSLIGIRFQRPILKSGKAVTDQLARDERLGEAALPSLALVLVGLVPVILLSRTLRSERRSVDAELL